MFAWISIEKIASIAVFMLAAEPARQARMPARPPDFQEKFGPINLLVTLYGHKSRPIVKTNLPNRPYL
ncbi:MAG: hypothetical protein A2521_10640 [Deltaproteobacteria bacterium RIFOXYD12_FULL_57_12]|nr:MAG: hypothetical protein A2521_10640 [Deltaproteobacteria bacterium RIFOXYD12_FULL_57_12]